jgi:hypothetical protein
MGVGSMPGNGVRSLLASEEHIMLGCTTGPREAFFQCLRTAHVTLEGLCADIFREVSPAASRS